MENIEIRPEDIPQGVSSAEVKVRTQIIRQFYRQWKELHPNQKMYNRSLRQDINIRMISIDETSSKASRDYRSTLAVLQLDAILTGAVKVASSKVKQGTANQNKFREMLIMHYYCPGIGLVKMTVGVRHKTFEKIQYCITCIEPAE